MIRVLLYEKKKYHNIKHMGLTLLERIVILVVAVIFFFAIIPCAIRVGTTLKPMVWRFLDLNICTGMLYAEGYPMLISEYKGMIVNKYHDLITVRFSDYKYLNETGNYVAAVVQAQAADNPKLQRFMLTRPIALAPYGSLHPTDKKMRGTATEAIISNNGTEREFATSCVDKDTVDTANNVWPFTWVFHRCPVLSLVNSSFNTDLCGGKLQSTSTVCLVGLITTVTESNDFKVDWRMYRITDCTDKPFTTIVAKQLDGGAVSTTLSAAMVNLYFGQHNGVPTFAPIRDELKTEYAKEDLQNAQV